MINLGIDNGNYNTKSSDGALYRTGFSASAQPPIGDADYIKLGGMYYTLDVDRAPVQYDKTQNGDMWIMTLAMLGRALNKRGEKTGVFRLGVGLPLMAYQAQREEMRRYFVSRGGARFGFRCREDYGDIEQDLDVRINDCCVYPQGYAAYLTQYKDLIGYSDIAHIDIGGYTIDIFRTHDGQPVPGSMYSIPMGTVRMLRAIDAELTRSDIRLPEEQIIDALRGSPIQHRRSIAAERAIVAGCDRYAQDITNTLRECGIDTHAPVNLIGGGAALLQNALGEQMYVIGTADIYANATGYALWLDREK